MDMSDWLSKWFLGAPTCSIGKPNLREFLAYGFFHSPLHGITSEQMGAVDGELCAEGGAWAVGCGLRVCREAVADFVAGMESQWGLHLSEERKEGVHFMAHNW